MNKSEMYNVLYAEIKDMHQKLVELREAYDGNKEDLNIMEDMVEWIKKSTIVLEEMNKA